MKKLFTLLVAGLLITACGNSNKKNTTDQVAEPQVIEAPQTVGDASVVGTYEGTIPAADASGIKTSLVLNADNTYQLTSEYVGKDNSTFNDQGTYSVEGDILTLTSAETNTFYRIGDKELLMLKADKTEPESELIDQYKLHKK